MFKYQRELTSASLLIMAMLAAPLTKAQVSGGSSSVTFVDAESPSGTMDGVNAAFLLTQAPSPIASLALTRNGIQLSLNSDYTVSGKTITFLSGMLPRPADLVRCSYRTTVTLSKAAGDGQSVAAGGPFATTMQVSVQDGNGNPVQGAVITFTAPNAGPGGTFAGSTLTATATTDAGGKATATPFKANSSVGSYSVSATLKSMYVNFSLTNTQSNLAQNNAATQSSNFPGYSFVIAASAVDGNTDGKFLNNSVTVTNFEANPWWQVDLGSTSTVNSILIWNRTDCCGDRLSDYWVFASNTVFAAGDTPTSLQARAGTWGSHQTLAPSPSTTILVGAVQARYVRVQLTGTNYLSLSEVQVMGTTP
jgi:hypothetical protein